MTLVSIMEIALHVSDLGRWSLDLRNGLVSWDDRTRSFFDFPEQEVVHYKQVLHYIEREDLKRVLRAVKMGIYSDVNRLCDIRYRTSVDVAGDVRWLHMVGKVYLDNGGQPSFFSGVVQNITQTVVQQKKMDAYHAEIARKKRKLQLIVECAQMGTLIYDAQMSQIHLGENSHMLFSFDSDDMSRANDLAKLNIKHFLESCKPEIIKAMEENTACEYIYQCIAPDGRSRWLRLNGRGVENEHSEMSIFYGLIIDITKQKLDEQQKLDFLNVSSHELKTPLTSLVGFLKILELKLQQQNIPDFKVILKKALEQSDRLKMLIGNFLELVKLETENIELNLRQVTVMDLISNFRSITANMVRDKISFDVNVGNESICCDCKKIEWSSWKLSEMP
ncbi:histidine kinase dimerization/phospho-acceptor domain-containing protein [Sphingobacterium thalpophilum]|uniref:sensor histidine kinase n=1 Tax=Sphingobacterium thalpophilum TaxID=259 RepID=UPI003C76D082